MSAIFPSVIVGYYLGKRLPKELRSALRSARNLEEVVATITVSDLYKPVGAARSLVEVEMKLRSIYYRILEEVRDVSLGRTRNAVSLILDRHAIRRTRAVVGAIERGIPPEERRYCVPVGFLTPEAIKAVTIDELRKYIPEKYRAKTIYDTFSVYRREALSADVGMGVKRMLERELGVRTLLLIIRARLSKELAREVEKLAAVDLYASPELVRNATNAKDRPEVLEILSGHPLYPYIKDLEDPLEAYFELHERIPEIVGFSFVPVAPSVERVYSGLKILEREIEKLVSVMNSVVI